MKWKGILEERGWMDGREDRGDFLGRSTVLYSCFPSFFLGVELWLTWAGLGFKLFDFPFHQSLMEGWVSVIVIKDISVGN